MLLVCLIRLHVLPVLPLTGSLLLRLLRLLSRPLVFLTSLLDGISCLGEHLTETAHDCLEYRSSGLYNMLHPS
jgi:hypothetical protein